MHNWASAKNKEDRFEGFDDGYRKGELNRCCGKKKTSRESYFAAESVMHRGQISAVIAILLVIQGMLGQDHVSGTACKRKKYFKGYSESKAKLCSRPRIWITWEKLSDKTSHQDGKCCIQIDWIIKPLLFYRSY